MEPICIEAFQGRTGIVHHFTMRATKVVSLRDLFHGSITSVQAMPRAYLDKLLRNVTLEGDKDCRPYKDCEIELARISPSDLVVGQTFVLRSKYQAFLEDSDDPLVTDFCIPRSIADRTALIVFGRTCNGEEVLAHYVPPIVEATNGNLLLLDGIHRNYSALQAGMAIESVVLKGVIEPLPFGTRCWSTIEEVDEKPPPAGRFHDLRREQFRDLKWVGING